MPILTRVFFRPNLAVGKPPRNEPRTVPQRAALSAQPCIEPLKGQMFWICFSAPEITTVSKPKRNPASAAVIDHRNSLGLEFFISATLAPCREMNMARILKTL